MHNNNFGIIQISEKIQASIFSFFTLLFFFVGQGFVYSLLFLSAIIIHELSHIIFLLHFGTQIKKVTVFPFGIDISADTRHLSYKKELVCTLSGSLANLFFALIGSVFLQFFPSPHLLFFVLCNIFLGTVNLIPLSFFDGGKALRLILYDYLDIDSAYYIYRLLDVISAFVFLCFSLFVIIGSNFNISVCAVIIYAAISTIALYKKKPV